ncbi:transglutaminase domain-containing protein [Flavobacterium sp. Root901]|uniref:transglutaminase domain-containing protein n=1 Tax=Flavobacterium sp. Root901 TaxID=1736605 RepID=UPI000A975665|nr:transglutaminase domain-containing protein [Flavobacterium sp. Root901]
MSFKKIFSILFFLNIVFINSTCSQQYIAIDSIVLKYPDFGSTEKLAEKINEDFKSDRDKARAIYSWIALNINYDLETYLNPPERKSYSVKDDADLAKKMQLINEKETQKAFRSRKAVCGGYSLIYAHLAALTGLKCQVITGDAKVKVEDIGRRNYLINHAWNTVLIDGKWILIDATWGGGYYDFKREILVKRFTPIYFDMDSKYFNAKHFCRIFNV